MIDTQGEIWISRFLLPTFLPTDLPGYRGIRRHPRTSARTRGKGGAVDALRAILGDPGRREPATCCQCTGITPARPRGAFPGASSIRSGLSRIESFRAHRPGVESFRPVPARSGALTGRLRIVPARSSSTVNASPV